MADYESDKYLLSECARMVNELNKIKGTNDKKTFLKDFVHLIPLIKRIYDPHAKTGITPDGLAAFVEKKKQSSMGTPLGLLDLFDALSSRKITGDAARASVLLLAEKFPDYAETVKSIMCKDLRIRMGEKLIISVFPNILKEFPVMLAKEYTPEEFEKLMKEHMGLVPPSYISRKLDGVRVLTIKLEGKEPRFFSRTGIEFKSLEKLKPEFKEIKGDWVTDGEAVVLEEDGTENFKSTVSQIKQQEKQMERPLYKVFDIIPYKEWEDTKATEIYSTRLARLYDFYGKSKSIEVVKQVPYSEQDMKNMIALAAKSGWEGLMLRFNHVWEAKRSKYLLKYKTFYDEEFVVQDVNIEDMRFPNKTGGEDTVKAVRNITILFRDNVVSVGSGFTKEERIRYAAAPETLRGKTITVQYQEPFQDAKTKKWSLRCPTLKTVWGDRKDV